MKKLTVKTINTKTLAGMALLSALSVVLALLIHFPIFPAVSFLEYDPADIPIFLGAFMYGPWAGLAITVVVSVIQGTTVSAASGFIGILMHIFATGSFVIVSGVIYKKIHSFKGALIGISAGIVTWVVGMILWNIIMTPIFMGVPRKVVIDLLGFIVAFNLVKVGINSFITILLYKRMHKLFEIMFRPHKKHNTDKIESSSEINSTKDENDINS